MVKSLFRTENARRGIVRNSFVCLHFLPFRLLAWPCRFSVSSPSTAAQRPLSRRMPCTRSRCSAAVGNKFMGAVHRATKKGALAGEARDSVMHPRCISLTCLCCGATASGHFANPKRGCSPVVLVMQPAAHDGLCFRANAAHATAPSAPVALAPPGLACRLATLLLGLPRAKPRNLAHRRARAASCALPRRSPPGRFARHEQRRRPRGALVLRRPPAAHTVWCAAQDAVWAVHAAGAAGLCTHSWQRMRSP